MIQITIVGAGVHGMRMAEVYGRFPGARIRAIVSKSRPLPEHHGAGPLVRSAEEWQTRFGRPSQNDVFDLCVHTDILLGVLSDFAAIGAKKFILPKPVVLTGHDLSRLEGLRRRYRLDIVVASQWHYASITKIVRDFMRKNRRKISRVELTYSGKISGERSSRYTPLSAYLPHALQILLDTKVISKTSCPDIENYSDSRIVVNYAGKWRTRVESDISAPERISMLEIYFSDKKRPVFSADLSFKRKKTGGNLLEFPYVAAGRKKTPIEKDVLEEMVGPVLRYFSGEISTANVLTLDAYLPVARALIQVNEYRKHTVAIIGGGIFGSLAALELAKRGLNAVLLEKEADILLGASLVNQCRVHMGYHYPRDSRTARETLAAKSAFENAFPSAIRKIDNFYLIAKHHTKTDAAAYERFCKDVGLGYEANFPKNVSLNREKIEQSYKVPEKIFDAKRLRRCIHTMISRQQKVRLHVSSRVEDITRMKDGFEIIYDEAGTKRKIFVSAVVNATYAGLNQINKMAGVPTSPYQYELCEEMVVRAPWKKTGWAILDGPFFGAMPFGYAREYLLYDVELSVLERSIGEHPHFKHDLAFYDKSKKRLARFKAYQNKWSEFIPDITRCKYVRSIHTVRAVLPKVDKTDARPTLVNELAPGYWQIFSGKITTSIPQASEVARAVELYLHSKS